MKKYTHIFFDLDRTLWDYDANARETLYDLVERYKIINGHPVDREQFVKEFFSINEELWARFDSGLIDKSYIRTKRFLILLERLNINDFENVHYLQEDFINECPTKGKLISGAESVVARLSTAYPLFIITNGFEEIQHLKLKYSGLESYFAEIITSERAKAQKPDPAIFDFALKVSKADRQGSVMIGDNYDSDISGAIAAGIDQIYYNPEMKPFEKKPTYVVSQLNQLSDILL